MDAQLYNGFFSDADRALMNIVLTTSPENLPALDVSFVDPRLKLLFFRYRARNFPHTLDCDEQLLWLDYRKSRFTQTRLEAYVAHLETLYHIYNRDRYKTQLLRGLFHYRLILLILLIL